MKDFELQKAVAKKRHGYVAFKPILDYGFNPPKECSGIVCYTECAEVISHDFLSANDEVLHIILEHKIALDFTKENPIKDAMERYLKL